MTDRILRLPSVIEMTGLCRSSVYQGVKEKWFPQPVKITKRAVGWRLSEVEAWIQSRLGVSSGVSQGSPSRAA